MAERFRRTIERASWNFRSLTISAGVASSRAGGVEVSKLVGMADEALLSAKKDGRNRVCGAGDLRVE
jgi:PleD family two-component response regulator